MKQDEVKLKIKLWADGIVDQFFPTSEGNLLDTFKNSTAHLWLDQNISKLDPILKAFADYKGNIDVSKVVDHYSQTLFVNGELRLDLKALIPNDYMVLKSILPNKLILLRANDIAEIFK